MTVLFTCRAPFLLAVLLRRADIAPELLSLLAEPAQSAVRSLGIMARNMRPAHVNAFLAALKEITVSAQAEAGKPFRRDPFSSCSTHAQQLLLFHTQSSCPFSLKRSPCTIEQIVMRC